MAKGGAREGAGRKAGVPNKATADVRELAGKYGQEAIEALVGIFRSGESDAARVAAANAILDRAYGKPKQDVGITGNLSVKVNVNFD